MANSIRYRLVSSLYGPGSVGCWQLTLCSVLVSWTLNRKYQTLDSIDNELLASLAFPAVAAGHLIHQVIHFPGSRAEIVTTQDEDLIPFSASIEASLNVCETFSSIALALFLIAVYNLRLKRAALVFIVGILCFGSEVMLFLQNPKADISVSSFTRPYILNTASIMIAILVILGAITLLFGLLRIYRSYREDAKREAAYRRWAVRHANLRQQIQSAGTRGDMTVVKTLTALLSEEMAVDMKDDGNTISATATLAIVLLPMSLLVTLGIPLGAWGVTKLEALQLSPSRILFFIPESGASLQELDQAVALVGGGTVLAFGMFEAFKSRIKTKTA